MVAHAGSVAVRMLADRVGLTGHLSTATTRRGFIPGHDRGRVLVDLATMVTAGGEAIAGKAAQDQQHRRVRHDRRQAGQALGGG